MSHVQVSPSKEQHRLTKHANSCRRIRRVKCDETKPQCRRCVSTGRACEGLPSSVIFVRQHEHWRQTTSDTLYRTPEIDPRSWLSTPQEQRAFDYYLQQVAPVMSGALDFDLWSVLLPRMAHSNAVVRYAIFAISSFWENPIRLALSWYANAISAGRAQSSDEAKGDILLRCTLFASLEFQQNNFIAGLKLLRTVFTMLAPFLTDDRHFSNSLTADKVVRTVLPMALRSSSLVFTSWEDQELAVSSHSSLDDLQIAVFRSLLAVWAGLKDMYLAKRANIHTHIARLVLMQTQERFQLSMLKDQIADKPVRDKSMWRCQALQEYCDIGLSWLDMLTREMHVQPDASIDFLITVLRQTSLIESRAETLYTAAASTTFFHEMIISPSAYFVAIFARNQELRAQALALMRRKAHVNHNSQLHAIVTSLDCAAIAEKDIALKNMFRVYHFQGEEPRTMNITYDLPIMTPASI